MFGYQSKSFHKVGDITLLPNKSLSTSIDFYVLKQNTPPSVRSCSDSKPNSASSGMKTENSFLTTPGDYDFQVQDDVSELRNWWAGLKSKTGCGICGSTAVYENFTTRYIREQLDAEYAINLSVQTAERIRRAKKMKEDRLREAAFTRSRWGRGIKFGEYKAYEPERTCAPPPRGKGKEREEIKIKKLGRLVGVASCPRCDICICLGCLNPLEDSQIAEVESLDYQKSLKTEGSHFSKSGLWCCDEGRFVALALVLACLDEDALSHSLSGNYLGGNYLGDNSPNYRGFGGVVKRGIRSLKDKMTEGAFQLSPDHKPKLKSRGLKGNGTGYGSGGYGNSVGLFGLDFHEPEDWEEADTSGSEDPDNDDIVLPTSSTIASATVPTGFIPAHANYSSYKPPSSIPSVHFSGLGQKPDDGNAAPTTGDDPPQPAVLSATDYIDFTMEDPPPPTFSGYMESYGGGMGASYLPWPGGHLGFAYRGRGTGRGRGGTHNIPHFPVPGQTLGGSVTGDLASNLSQKTPGEFPGADKLPSSELPSVWAHHFPQYPAGALPQEALDDLLTKALVHSGPVNLSGSGSSELDNILLESIVSPDFALPSPFHPIPYSTGNGGMPRFPPGMGDRPIRSLPPPPPLSPEQTKYDKTLAALMSLLTELLPRPSGDSLFDLAPPPLLKVMLRTSMLVEKAEELLRNDSVQDISIRSEMYITFMGLLQRICACSETEFLVTERRRKKLHTIGLLRIAKSLPIPNDLLEFGPKTRGKIAAAAEERRRAEVLVYEENSDRKTLIEVSANLCTQAKFFLKGAEKSEGEEFDGTEATKILGICLEIVGIKEQFEKLASKAPRSGGSSSPEGIIENKNRHHASSAVTEQRIVPPQLEFGYHGPIAFEYTENVLDTHHYKLQAGNLQQSPRGRVLHLTRELATMSTSLPQGIFVRVEDSRPDVLKVLIVGPGGTPYEGGLYEWVSIRAVHEIFANLLRFDIWAPMEYPISPPLCIFKTTGGGSVHFNPNLYNCGKGTVLNQSCFKLMKLI